MALPIASSPADITGDICCDTLALIADRIRTVAARALEECLDPDCASREFRSFATVGPLIQDPLGESLIVHMTNVGPTPQSADRSANLLPVGLYRADFQVQLLETGWPVIEVDELGNAIQVPDSDIVNALTLHSMSHAEKMYRALADGIQRRTLFASASNPHIGKIQLSNLTPVQPTSFLVGWNCAVRVETTLP